MDSLMAHQTKGPNSQSGIGSVLSTGQSSQDMGPDSQELDLSCQPDSHLRTWDQSVTQELDLSCQLDNHLRTRDQTEKVKNPLTQAAPQGVECVEVAGTSNTPVTLQVCDQVFTVALARCTAVGAGAARWQTVAGFTPANIQVSFTLQLQGSHLPTYRSASFYRQLQGLHLPTYRSASLYSYRVHSCQHTGQLHFTVAGFTPAIIQVSFTLQLQGSSLPTYRSVLCYSYRVHTCQHTG